MWLTRGTIWLALIAYAVASTTLIISRSPHSHKSLATAWARYAWTVGCLALWAHWLAAFQAYYGWSHTEAVRQTAARTQALLGVAVGQGIWMNYALAVVWLADSAWWWLVGDARYEDRKRITCALHAFFVFMIINGAILFVSGPARILGGCVLAAPALAWWWRRRRRSAVA